MKGIILAGGTGSRLRPLTKVTNKHLLPVGKDPMIIHTVKKFSELGIQEVIVITGTDHMGDIVSLLGSGKEYGCNFTYRVQDEPTGIAGALSLCENFINGDSILVILGDNIFEEDLSSMIDKFNQHVKKRNGEPSALFMLKKVELAERFGVAFIEDEKIINIVEKPKNPKSDLCVTGVYMYDNNVFDFARLCKVSKRGELEITDVNNHYINAGGATYCITSGWWTDAGTHDSYQLANRLMCEKK